MRFNSIWRFGTLAAMLLSGCAGADRATSRPPGTVIASTSPATAPSAGKSNWPEPWMVHEANLPLGFPPPGPIGQVILKSYPACRAATVAAADVKGQGQDPMFMSLFNHIQKQKISMTAPVQMDFNRPGETGPSTRPSPPTAMSFMYSSRMIGETGKDGVVTIHDLPPVTVLSIGVRGNYDGPHFLDAMKAINAWLASHPRTYEPVGSPRFLGYNSPFVPWFLRYGEVQVPVVPSRTR